MKCQQKLMQNNDTIIKKSALRPGPRPKSPDRYRWPGGLDCRITKKTKNYAPLR